MQDDSQKLIHMYLNFPFHRWLGLKFQELLSDQLILTFDMRPDFIGNVMKGILSGGITSAVLDITGGLFGLLKALEKMHDLTEEEKLQRLAAASTIDMRIDYLKVGAGKSFTLKSRVLRSGRRITVTHTELFNEAGDLVAAGTGAYLMG